MHYPDLITAGNKAQLRSSRYLGDFEELRQLCHPVEEFLVDVQRVLALVLLHVKVLLCGDRPPEAGLKGGSRATETDHQAGFALRTCMHVSVRVCLRARVTQQVDDPLVVSGKQPYGVFEEQHEG